MEIVHYLEPAEKVWDSVPGIRNNECLGNFVNFFQGNENWFRNFNINLVIIGVPEDRNGFDNRCCSKSPYEIRKSLYGLNGWGNESIIGDAGNIRGKGLNDRYQALKEVMEWFLQNNATVIVLGGTQDITLPVYRALSGFQKDITMVIGDAMIDLDVANQDFSSRSWINKIFEESGGALGDLTVMGPQKYLISLSQENFFQENYFEILRLGEIRGTGINKTEIPLRDCTIVSLDLRMCSGQYQINDRIRSPHGVEHFEACQISRYAGLSDQLKVFGLFEAGVEDKNGLQNIALASQMVWYFIDGFLSRYKDFPIRKLEEYKYYVVHLEEFNEGLKFYQNQINGRWWMEVPSENGFRVVACDIQDYRKALRKELPEKWWRFFLKCKGEKLGAL